MTKLDSSGNHLWSRSFEVDGGARNIAADADGNVLLTGFFGGSVDFGGGPLHSNRNDIFVAKFDASGNHLWSRNFDATSVEIAEIAYSIEADADGNVLLAGHFVDTVDFGGELLTSAGVRDIFVAKLDSSGNHLWSRHFGDADEQYARSIAVDTSGNVLLTGEFSGTVDFGDTPLISAGGRDIFIAKLTP